MQFKRSIEYLMIMPVANIVLTIIFCVAFSYLKWGTAYDVLWAAIGLVCIGGFFTALIGFEAIVLYSVWYWYIADADTDKTGSVFPVLSFGEHGEN